MTTTPTTSAKDRARELLDELHDQVAALTTSDDWQNWLRVAARFHRYSFHNPC
jgi:DNA-binding GntR family transcriptional regulator